MKTYRVFFLNIKYLNKKMIVYELFIAILFGLYVVSYFHNNSKEISVCFGDVFLLLFGGIEYKKNSIISYSTWLGFIIILYYPIIAFISKEISEKKLFAFYRIKKYKYWYYSNIMNSLLKVFLYLILIYGVVFIIASIFMGFDGIVKADEFNSLKTSMPLNKLIISIFLLNYLFISAIVLLTISTYLITKNIKIATLIIITITYLTSFIVNGSIGKFLIGNLAMMRQNSSFITGNKNITFTHSIEVFIFIIIVSLILGHLLYRRNIEI
ncbi:hypothetical protein [Clostridium sp. 'White wine YQ']|uniref:hypothetical protein n=1 Tax=Clostridium sp. 'White wine YQ' TaxID=3027474 RepID=UPI002367234A|nr:hypothetical protein [Clostridium sp. 'White wine YQ']MDD7796063.1 hypothetical protein [Clostridium sp. 'White wine YQ']